MRTTTFLTAPTPHPLARKSPAHRQQILVPFDFSQSSVNALRHAAEVAARNQALLTVVNVIVEPISFRTLDKVGLQHDRQQSQCNKLRAAAKREIGAGVSARLVICEGNPSEEITRLAGEQGADLIVVGEHEHHGLRQLFRRHIARKLVAKARCPVVVLGHPQADPEPDQRAA